MPLPHRWVEHLFARLAVRYGGAFLRQYGDADPALVQADWADVLDGLSGEAIGYALRYLPADRPPNAMQFRDLARRAPGPTVPQLPRQRTEPPAGVRDLAARMRARPRNAAQECIDNIARAVSARGGRATDAQRYVVEHCLKTPGATLPASLAGDPRFASWVAWAAAAGEIWAPRDDRGAVEAWVATEEENAASGRKSTLPGDCRHGGGMATFDEMGGV